MSSGNDWHGHNDEAVNMIDDLEVTITKIIEKKDKELGRYKELYESAVKINVELQKEREQLIQRVDAALRGINSLAK